MAGTFFWAPTLERNLDPPLLMAMFRFQERRGGLAVSALYSGSSVRVQALAGGTALTMEYNRHWQIVGRGNLAEYWGKPETDKHPIQAE